MTYRHERYEITLKLTVSDEDNDGIWVVSEDSSDIFGDGLTPYAAVVDFLECKAEIMKALFQGRDHLGKGLREELVGLVVWAEGRPNA